MDQLQVIIIIIIVIIIVIIIIIIDQLRGDQGIIMDQLQQRRGIQNDPTTIKDHRLEESGGEDRAPLVGKPLVYYTNSNTIALFFQVSLVPTFKQCFFVGFIK